MMLKLLKCRFAYKFNIVNTEQFSDKYINYHDPDQQFLSLNQTVSQRPSPQS